LSELQKTRSIEVATDLLHRAVSVRQRVF